MKHKQLKELRDKNISELKALVVTVRRELVEVGVNTAVRKERNTRLAASKRHHLAQVLTVLREKELDA